jgi:hypothetical protein
MAITPEEFQAWTDRHAAHSARVFPLHERWLQRHTLDQEARAALEQELNAFVKGFEQFKDMPEEVWDELLADWPDTTA